MKRTLLVIIYGKLVSDTISSTNVHVDWCIIFTFNEHALYSKEICAEDHIVIKIDVNPVCPNGW